MGLQIGQHRSVVDKVAIRRTPLQQVAEPVGLSIRGHLLCDPAIEQLVELLQLAAG